MRSPFDPFSSKSRPGTASAAGALPAGAARAGRIQVAPDLEFPAVRSQRRGARPAPPRSLQPHPPRVKAVRRHPPAVAHLDPHHPVAQHDALVVGRVPPVHEKRGRQRGDLQPDERQHRPCAEEREPDADREGEAGGEDEQPGQRLRRHRAVALRRQAEAGLESSGRTSLRASSMLVRLASVATAGRPRQGALRYHTPPGASKPRPALS